MHWSTKPIKHSIQSSLLMKIHYKYATWRERKTYNTNSNTLWHNGGWGVEGRFYQNRWCCDDLLWLTYQSWSTAQHSIQSRILMKIHYKYATWRGKSIQVYNTNTTHSGTAGVVDGGVGVEEVLPNQLMLWRPSLAGAALTSQSWSIRTSAGETTSPACPGYIRVGLRTLTDRGMLMGGCCWFCFTLNIGVSLVNSLQRQFLPKSWSAVEKTWTPFGGSFRWCTENQVLI